MDLMDIYDDLDEFHEKEEKKTKEFLSLEAKYNEALKTIEAMISEKKVLQKKIHTMERNLQSLLDTAKAEVKRKDKMIDELRKEKDDICFRRRNVAMKHQPTLHDRQITGDIDQTESEAASVHVQDTATRVILQNNPFKKEISVDANFDASAEHKQTTDARMYSSKDKRDRCNDSHYRTSDKSSKSSREYTERGRRKSRSKSRENTKTEAKTYRRANDDESSSSQRFSHRDERETKTSSQKFVSNSKDKRYDESRSHVRSRDSYDTKRRKIDPRSSHRDCGTERNKRHSRSPEHEKIEKRYHKSNDERHHHHSSRRDRSREKSHSKNEIRNSKGYSKDQEEHKNAYDSAGNLKDDTRSRKRRHSGNNRFPDDSAELNLCKEGCNEDERLNHVAEILKQELENLTSSENEEFNIKSDDADTTASNTAEKHIKNVSKTVEAASTTIDDHNVNVKSRESDSFTNELEKNATNNAEIKTEELQPNENSNISNENTVLDTPKKIALFDALFGASPKQNGHKTSGAGELLANVKEILDRCGGSSKTTSLDAYTDVSDVSVRTGDSETTKNVGKNTQLPLVSDSLAACLPMRIINISDQVCNSPSSVLSISSSVTTQDMNLKIIESPDRSKKLIDNKVNKNCDDELDEVTKNLSERKSKADCLAEGNEAQVNIKLQTISKVSVEAVVKEEAAEEDTIVIDDDSITSLIDDVTASIIADVTTSNKAKAAAALANNTPITSNKLKANTQQCIDITAFKRLEPCANELIEHSTNVVAETTNINEGLIVPEIVVKKNLVKPKFLESQTTNEAIDYEEHIQPLIMEKITIADNLTTLIEYKSINDNGNQDLATKPTPCTSTLENLTSSLIAEVPVFGNLRKATKVFGKDIKALSQTTQNKKKVLDVYEPPAARKRYVTTFQQTTNLKVPITVQPKSAAAKSTANKKKVCHRAEIPVINKRLPLLNDSVIIGSTVIKRNVKALNEATQLKSVLNADILNLTTPAKEAVIIEPGAFKNYVTALNRVTVNTAATAMTENVAPGFSASVSVHHTSQAAENSVSDGARVLKKATKKNKILGFEATTNYKPEAPKNEAVKIDSTSVNNNATVLNQVIKREDVLNALKAAILRSKMPTNETVMTEPTGLTNDVTAFDAATTLSTIKNTTTSLIAAVPVQHKVQTANKTLNSDITALKKTTKNKKVLDTDVKTTNKMAALSTEETTNEVVKNNASILNEATKKEDVLNANNVKSVMPTKEAVTIEPIELKDNITACDESIAISTTKNLENNLIASVPVEHNTQAAEKNLSKDFNVWGKQVNQKNVTTNYTTTATTNEEVHVASTVSKRNVTALHEVIKKKAALNTVIKKPSVTADESAIIEPTASKNNVTAFDERAAISTANDLTTALIAAVPVQHKVQTANKTLGSDIIVLKRTTKKKKVLDTDVKTTNKMVSLMNEADSTVEMNNATALNEATLNEEVLNKSMPTNKAVTIDLTTFKGEATIRLIEANSTTENLKSSLIANVSVKDQAQANGTNASSDITASTTSDKSAAPTKETVITNLAALKDDQRALNNSAVTTTTLIEESMSLNITTVPGLKGMEEKALNKVTFTNKAATVDLTTFKGEATIQLIESNSTTDNLNSNLTANVSVKGQAQATSVKSAAPTKETVITDTTALKDDQRVLNNDAVTTTTLVEEPITLNITTAPGLKESQATHMLSNSTDITAFDKKAALNNIVKGEVSESTSISNLKDTFLNDAATASSTSTIAKNAVSLIDDIVAGTKLLEALKQTMISDVETMKKDKTTKTDITSAKHVVIKADITADNVMSQGETLALNTVPSNNITSPLKECITDDIMSTNQLKHELIGKEHENERLTIAPLTDATICQQQFPDTVKPTSETASNFSSKEHTQLQSQSHQNASQNIEFEAKSLADLKLVLKKVSVASSIAENQNQIVADENQLAKEMVGGDTSNKPMTENFNENDSEVNKLCIDLIQKEHKQQQQQNIEGITLMAATEEVPVENSLNMPHIEATTMAPLDKVDHLPPQTQTLEEIDENLCPPLLYQTSSDESSSDLIPLAQLQQKEKIQIIENIRLPTLFKVKQPGSSKTKTKPKRSQANKNIIEETKTKTLPKSTNAIRSAKIDLIKPYSSIEQDLLATKLNNDKFNTKENCDNDMEVENLASRSITQNEVEGTVTVATNNSGNNANNPSESLINPTELQSAEIASTSSTAQVLQTPSNSNSSAMKCADKKKPSSQKNIINNAKTKSPKKSYIKLDVTKVSKARGHKRVAEHVAKPQPKRQRKTKANSKQISTPKPKLNTSDDFKSMLTAETSPLSMPASQPGLNDAKFADIDKNMQAIFQSPMKIEEQTSANENTTINETIAEVSASDATADTSEQRELELAVSSILVNDNNSINTTVEGNNTSFENSFESKRLSLGASEYLIERVSENVVTMFITRKRRKKPKDLQHSN